MMMMMTKKTDGLGQHGIITTDGIIHPTPAVTTVVAFLTDPIEAGRRERRELWKATKRFHAVGPAYCANGFGAAVSAFTCMQTGNK